MSFSALNYRVLATHIDSLSKTSVISGNDVREVCQKLVMPLNSSQYSIKYRAEILQSLCKYLENDPPAHVEFQGNQSSYISLKSTSLFNCPRGYTLTFWICVDNWETSKRVTLFKLKSDEAAVEAFLSYGNSFENVSFSLQISLSTSSGSLKQFEMQGMVNIQPAKWHFFTVKHSTQMNRSHASFCVNGKVVVEKDMVYPPFGTNQSTWDLKIGTGLAGKIASVVLFSAELDLLTLSLMHDAGPHSSARYWHVSGPQSSFDSGHCKLGTRLIKEVLASTRDKLVFCLCPLHLVPGSNLALAYSGKHKNGTSYLTIYLNHTFRFNYAFKFRFIGARALHDVVFW